MKWTNKELFIITSNYPHTNKKVLLNKLPNRSWKAIILKAMSLKIKRELNEEIKSDLSPLLKDNPISYYWIGFLLADGHFSKSNRLILEISKIDKGHIQKFSKFIKSKYRPNKNSIGVYCMDKNKVCLIVDKFDINNNKTKYPPKISSLNILDDLLFSLIIGYIDGDGSIRIRKKNRLSYLSLQVHKSWLNNLIFFENFLYKYFNYSKNKQLSKLNKRKYAHLGISDNYMLSLMKKRLIELKLPVLKRKWNRVIYKEKSHISIKNDYNSLSNKIIEMYETNNNISYIAKQLNKKYSTIYMFIKRRNLL